MTETEKKPWWASVFSMVVQILRVLTMFCLWRWFALPLGAFFHVPITMAHYWLFCGLDLLWMTWNFPRRAREEVKNAEESKLSWEQDAQVALLTFMVSLVSLVAGFGYHYAFTRGWLT